MLLITLMTAALGSPMATAMDTTLRVAEYDSDRQRANISLSNDSFVPLGTKLRINASSGDSCIIEIIERVNKNLIAKTPDCNGSIVRPGLTLAYSDGRAPTSYGVTSSPLNGIEGSTPMEPSAEFNTPTQDVSSSETSWASGGSEITGDEQDWPTEGQFGTTSPNRTSTSSGILPSSMASLRDRISVYIGHNFSSNLEGKVYADGSYKDLGGDSAFSLGVQGNVYNITPKINVAVGLGYEFARTFDEATIVSNNISQKGRPLTGNPRMSLWSLYSQVEGQLLDKLVAFGGINFSVPFMSGVTWDAGSDLGFQAGANYEVFDRVRLEGLIKISNINLKNELGQTTDVSLAGVELRGRYTF